MGSGASKRESDAGVARTASKKEKDDVFNSACLMVFTNADKDGNGVLDSEEFMSVLKSETLNLKLSQEEMEEIQRKADANSDGAISYKEFIPIVKDILKKVAAKKETDWNDWVKISKNGSGQGGDVIYYNKRTGASQRTQPENYNEQLVEEQRFEPILLADGTEVWTYVRDDGVRMYMADWETQEWKPWDGELPETAEAVFGSGDDDDDDDDADPRFGEFEHPTKGTLTTYLYECTRTSYLYADENDQWVRMPLAWERTIPEVKEMLEVLNATFPDWKNVNEQLLVLRECNFNVQEAITFAHLNWNFRPPREVKTVSFKERPATPPPSDLSLAAADYIDALKKQLAEKEDKISKLQATHEEGKKEEFKALSREKTQVETAMQRQERLAQEAEEKSDKLQKRVRELEDKVNDLERDLVEAQAQAGKGGAGGSEDLRVENTQLKLKLQQARQQMAQPAKNAALMSVVKDWHSKVSSAQSTQRTASSDLRKDIDELSKMFTEARAMSKKLGDNVQEQVRTITAKYRAEVVQRKLLYNKVQELRGNIRVFLRVRYDPRVDCIMQFPSDTEVMLPTLQGGKELMDWDHVYGPKSTQEQVFENTRPIVMSCVDGYNVCIIAYGQTGSGKTFTMMGPEDNPGVNRRAIKELLGLVQAQDEINFSLKVSLMEVYNEKIYDLLVSSREKTLQVHQGPNGVYVGDLTEVDVSSLDDVERVMRTGDKNRSTASTKMNTDSSRSHLLLQITVTGHNKISNVTSVGKLTLVDLAGSERQSKTEASGERLVEAAAINKSLTSLGQVFKALSSNSPHVPYRNSKLTHVLQDSLGGDSKTAMFINVSPAESNLAESHCTLNFGKNIRKIELGPASKHKGAGGKPPPPKAAPKKR